MGVGRVFWFKYKFEGQDRRKFELRVCIEVLIMKRFNVYGKIMVFLEGKKYWVRGEKLYS